MSRHGIPSLTTLACILLAACGATDATGEPTTVEPRPKASAALEISAEAGDGVTAMQPACAEGSQERCDAIDGDCDGRVDEGCGYGGGALQITAAWGAGADLDLEITEPGGNMLGGETARTDAGGELDRAGEGRCAGPDVDRRVEDARWAEDPPAGDYEVAIRYVDGCDVEGAVTATVTVSADDRVVGVYNRTVEPSSGKLAVATVRVSRAGEASATP